jgi:hypothetical protein
MKETSLADCWPQSQVPLRFFPYRLPRSGRRIVHGRHRVVEGTKYGHCREGLAALCKYEGHSVLPSSHQNIEQKSFLPLRKVSHYSPDNIHEVHGLTPDYSIWLLLQMRGVRALLLQRPIFLVLV